MANQSDTTTVLDHDEAASDIVFDGEVPTDTHQTSTSDPDKSESSGDESGQAAPEGGTDDPLGILNEGETASESSQGPVEDPEVDSIKEPDGLKDLEGWKGLKSVATERKQQIAELEAKVERYEKGDVSQASQAEIEGLREELKSAQERLTQYDVRESPEFRATYEKPVADAVESIKSTVKEFEADLDGFDPTSFEGMTLKQAADKVRQIADGDDILQAELMRSVNQIRQTVLKRDAALADAPNLREQLQEQRLRESKRVFDKVGEQFRDNFKPLTVPEDADDATKTRVTEYNESVGQIGQIAEKIAIGQTTPDEVARVAHEAASYRHLMAHGLPQIGRVYGAKIEGLQGQVRDLTDKLARVTKQTPGVKDGSTGGDTGSGPLDHDVAAAQIDFSR